MERGEEDRWTRTRLLLTEESIKFFDITGEIESELRLIRIAAQSIAQSLIRATELPAAPTLDKPVGPESVGTYGNSLDDLEGDDANSIRERLRAAGITDSEIEQQLVEWLAEEQAD